MKSFNTKDFNPRPPRGGRQTVSTLIKAETGFQSTPPARGATSGYQYEDLRLVLISIHAPREGGDFMFLRRGPVTYDFNPRPPRGGRRLNFLACSGLSLISIHAPREGGDMVRVISMKICV